MSRALGMEDLNDTVLVLLFCIVGVLLAAMDVNEELRVGSTGLLPFEDELGTSVPVVLEIPASILFVVVVCETVVTVVSAVVEVGELRRDARRDSPPVEV